MKLTPLASGMIRTPVFSLEDSLENIWDALKMKIALVSPDFFSRIKDLDYAHLELAPDKIRFTIWKYYNRSKFRATPFAGLASFSVVSGVDEHMLSGIEIQRMFTDHAYINWEQKDKVGKQTRVQINELIVNSTLYCIGREIRYVSFKNERFSINSVEKFPELLTVLDLCRQKITVSNLKSSVMEALNLDNSLIDQLIDDMIDSQLIWTNQFPNITGQDYFQRIGVKQSEENSAYIISERLVNHGKIDLNPLKHVSEFISFMNAQGLESKFDDLCAFKEKFIKRFGQSEIQLSLAMDPEAGIGYGSLEHADVDSDLIDALKSETISTGNKSLNYTPLHGFLLNKLIYRGPIRLEEFKEAKQETKINLPNTMSVIYHLFDDKPVILALGGCTATSLLGRFSLASQAVTDIGNTIVALEERANQDVIFFDIAYQAEKTIDNVNRRNSLYSHELPILTWSCIDGSLDLNDMLISVQRSEIVLTSRRFGKRIVPRLASAYNYSRSDLAVYRFLCDLQHQKLKTNLAFDPQDFFPDLDFYPRVLFKDIIVSPAKWKFHRDVVMCGTVEEKGNALNRLKTWLNKRGIENQFKAGLADQTLCFDTQKDWDLLSFIDFTRQQKLQEFYISEALIQKSSSVKDEAGSNYHAEFVVNLYHEHNIYGITKPTTWPKLTTEMLQDSQLPGGEWLYFEIYCHQLRLNDILVNYIQPFIKRNLTHIKIWFFIRYNDPAPHVRLRLKLKQSAALQSVIQEIQNLLREEVTSGLVQSVEIKTYVRETQRYGAKRILLVEHFFCHDSKYCLELIKKTADSHQLYATTLIFLQDLLQVCFKDISSQIEFVTVIGKSLSRELNTSTTGFKKLNSAFKTLQIDMKNLVVDRYCRMNTAQRVVLMKILARCEAEDKQSIIADLIHMHINRLFPNDPRVHEMIIYQYLRQYLTIISFSAEQNASSNFIT